MTDVVERLGRVNHPIFGECVKVKLNIWTSVDNTWETIQSLYPKNQAKFGLHPRCPSGFTENGHRNCLVSPTFSGYSDLVKYASFKWKD